MSECSLRAAAPPPNSTMDLPILLYHHLVEAAQVAPGSYEISFRQFEEQLDLLQILGFKTISFADLCGALDTPRCDLSKVAILTFDDAFRSFHRLALPALLRRSMRATVFVPVGEIGGTNRWDAAAGYPRREVMSESELREIADAGMEIGSHGWTHRSLPECSEREIEEELVRSRERLRDLGHHAEFFAYPFGHYSERCIDLVKAAGYRAAASIFSDAASVTANRFALRRIYIHPADTALRFRCKLSRPYLRYKAIRGRPPENDFARA